MEEVYNSMYFHMVILSFLLPMEINLVHKEINNQIYSVEAILSRFIIEVFYYCLFTTLMNCVLYFPVGLNNSRESFFTFVYILLSLKSIQLRMDILLEDCQAVLLCLRLFGPYYIHLLYFLVGFM